MFKRLIIGLAAALVLLLVSTNRPALAHPYVIQTDPPDGATLNEAPGEIRIFLNQGVLLDFTTIELVDGDGRHISPLAVSLETNVSQKAGEGSASLLVKLPPLESNTYRMAWKTRSEDDFHITSGAIVFGVQRAVVEQAGPPPPLLPAWPEVVLRWLSFMAVAVVSGLLFLALLVVPGPHNAAKPGGPQTDGSEPALNGIVTLQNRLLRLARFSGWLALASGMSFLVWEGLADSFSWAGWWELLTATAFGQRWLLGEVILALLLALLYLAPQQLYFRRFKVAVIILLAGLTGAASQNTHAGLPGSWPWLNFLADSLHLMGASAWIGGLAGLLWGLGPILVLRQSSQIWLAWLVLRRFSLLAAVSVPVLAVTGLYKSGQQIASLDGLFTTLYGQALLLKFQLVLFAGLLGLFNALLLHPGLRAVFHLSALGRWVKPRLLRRTLLVESVALVGVVFIAAFMSAAEPARGPEFQPNPVAQTSQVSNYSASMDDLVVNFSVKPNLPGRNFLDLYLYNTRRPAPGPFEKVGLILRSPGGQEINLDMASYQVQPNHYQLSGDQIQAGGKWQIEVTVNRPALPVSKSTFDWKVGQNLEPVTRRPVIFSNQPLAPWFNLGAVVVMVLAITLWAGWWVLKKTFFSSPLTALFTIGAVKRD